MGNAELGVVLATFWAITVHVAADTKTHYVGGVVEYRRFWDYSLDPKVNMLLNVKNYTEIMALGKERGIDIMVFPEVGLQAASNPELVPVPEVSARVTPRLDRSQHEALRKLSEGAYENYMYVVVNLKEISDSFIYNTNVAFDRNGTIVGRYRKFHPFGENVTKPDAPEHSYFDTDFGARFGMFTCFDILFDEPGLVLVKNYNVTDVAYPTAWYSQLPFLTAIQYQASWSYGTGVNLLASSLNHVDVGTTGSGIYMGFKGPSDYILSERDGCKLIYQRIPIAGHAQELNIESGERSRCSLKSAAKIKILKENLDIYKTELIDPEYNSERSAETITAEKTKIKTYYLNENVCQGDFCCNFELEFNMTFAPEFKESEVKGDDFQYFRYRMAVLDGVRDFEGEGTGGLQVCGVISCLDENIDTCAVRADSVPTVQRLTVHDEAFGKLLLQKTVFNQISIRGNFQKSHSFVSPNVLIKSNKIGEYGAIPPYRSFRFTKVEEEDNIRSRLFFNNKNKGNISLVTAAIYSRVYDRDGQTPGDNRSSTFSISSFTLGTITLTLLVYKMYLFDA